MDETVKLAQALQELASSGPLEVHEDGQWLAEHISNARVRLDPNQGHLSLAVKALDRILDDLIAIAR